MKEHEDCGVCDSEKSSAIVDEIVTGKGKIEGDEGEDMMVDVVGADAVDLDRKQDSVRLIEEKETEIRDLNMDMKEEVAGLGEDVGVDIAVIDNKELIERDSIVEEHVESVEDCVQKETKTCDLNMNMNINMEEAVVSVEDDSAGNRVLSFEKVEVKVNEEDLKTSIEVRDCETDFESKGESQSGGADIAAIDNNKEQHVESVVECKQKETETRDLNMNTEEAAVSGEDDSAGNRVLGFEKVEVKVNEEGLNTSLEVSKDILVTTCGSLVQDSKESSVGGGESVAIDNKDVIKRGSTEEVMEQNVESVDELADEDRVVDRKTENEAEVSDSSKITEVDVMVVEGFASKDEAKDCVFKDPSLVSANNQNSSTELVNVGSDEVSGRSKEESLQPSIEVKTDDSQGNASGEPCFVGGENDSKNEEESDMKQPMECDQEMGVEDCNVNEKIVKESEPLDSSKISEPSTTTNPGSEDVDVVVVDAGLAAKDEPQDSVSVDQNLVCEGDVIAQPENVDQQDEVIANDTQNLENGTGVGVSKSGADPFSGEPRFDVEIAEINIEETEKGLAAKDGVIDEKTGKRDEVLDSSKIQKPLTATTLGPEEFLTPKIDGEFNTISKDERVHPSTEVSSLVESQMLEVNSVLDHSRPDVHASTEPEPVKRMPPVTADKIIKIESEDLDCIMYNKPSNEVSSTGEMNGFRVSAEAFEEVKHCVVDSGFSYEDGHMERGEDAGMDIDEVLGWKDEISGIDVLSGDPEKDQHFKINPDSEMGFKKRKVLDSIPDVSEKQPSPHPEKAPFLTPKPAFKVGECIQRVATQLSGPPKSTHDPNGQHVDQLVGPENSQIETGKQSSVVEMLSQLHLVAQDPMERYGFLNTIIPFFYDHRAVGRPVAVRKRKTSNENEPEEFEFDDVNDSYWTDRIIQNHPEEQLLNGGQEQHQQHHVVAYEPEKPAKPNRRSNKKRFLFSNHEMGLKEQSELVERRRQNLATEVVLKFPEGFYFPSEIHLNKMFRRFGALMESETEVDRQNGRARVVFKKCCDAEVAHSSAGKFNIFGPINVNYELNYTPLVSYKPLLLSVLQQGSMDAS